MSRTGKVVFVLGMGVLVVVFGLTAFSFWALNQQVRSYSDDLDWIATENARLAAELTTLETWNSYQSTQIGAQQGLLNQLAASLPDSSQGGLSPTFTPTAFITLTPWDRSVGVVIEDGSCCVGGTAGESIMVHVRFLPEQTELAEPAMEMRVMTGPQDVTAVDMTKQPWQPLVEEASYEVYLWINWTTFWVHVQYRTAGGSISAIYSDEIAVEGMPVPPTETP